MPPSTPTPKPEPGKPAHVPHGPEGVKPPSAPPADKPPSAPPADKPPSAPPAPTSTVSPAIQKLAATIANTVAAEIPTLAAPDSRLMMFSVIGAVVEGMKAAESKDWASFAASIKKHLDLMRVDLSPEDATALVAAVNATFTTAPK